MISTVEDSALLPHVKVPARRASQFKWLLLFLLSIATCIFAVLAWYFVYVDSSRTSEGVR